MNKKLHKTGTTILLALAPACAIGVVGGIVVSSLNQGDVERTLTFDEYMTEYTKIYNRYKADYEAGIKYTTQDVTDNKVSGSGENYNQDAPAWCWSGSLTGLSYTSINDWYCLTLSFGGNKLNCSSVYLTPDEWKQELEYLAWGCEHPEYKINNGSISYAFSWGGNFGKWLTINKYGYITDYHWYQDSGGEVGHIAYTTYNINYSIPPHK